MKYLTYLLMFFLLCFLALSLRPVPAVTAENAQTQTGIVSNISEGGIKDVVFHLEENNHHFYINRGLENTFVLEDLQNDLIGKELTFTFANHWTPLDWSNKSTHISKLELGKEILYDETLGSLEGKAQNSK